MKRLLIAVLAGSLFFISCKQSPRQKLPPVAPRDTTISAINSFSELFMDSLSLEKFVALQLIPDSLANRLRSFYNSRNYQYAWFLNDGIAPYTLSFQDLQDEYISYSRDSSLYNPALWDITDSLSQHMQPFRPDSTILRVELELTSQFFRYASHAYQGRYPVDLKDLGWYIPRKRINPALFLDSLIKNKGAEVSQYEPVYRQYQLLKNHLLKYYAIEKRGGWNEIPAAGKAVFKKGDTGPAIAAIKRRLQLSGDYDINDSSALFNDSLRTAVMNFQRRYGFSSTGIIDRSLIAEMNRPVEERIRQILINMERIRWMPVQPPAKYLLVNIPEYRLHVYENGGLTWSMNVVVGSAAHNTVIFKGDMQYIVFSPYWNVPLSIYRNEVLPGMKRNPNYLAKHNMEKYGNSVRQKPGPGNSLGLVKFLFPNSYNIYLHDTPTRSLFREDARAFSHGCIRLAEPKKLAQFLLRDNPAWDSLSITKAMNAGKEKYVTLSNPVPVYIGYFTSWVDAEGNLNFRNDIYGHDKKMASHLFMP